MSLSYGRHLIEPDDVAAVAAALESEFLTQGPLVEEFERRFAARVGARHAVAVSSGTAALHLAMRVAGVGPGDRVITSPNTFVASANAAAYVGATPDFADIDAVAYCLDPAALAARWSDDIAAVVAVDYAGQASDLRAIAAFARARGAVVIDDACHAVGTAFHTDDGRRWPIGGNPWADITVFSFHPVKTITTGEGGMLVTDRADWADRARLLRSHGLVRDHSRFMATGADAASELETSSWPYQMQDLGYNYRLTEIQSALGIRQLSRLDRFAERRRRIVAAYNAGFAGLDWLRTPGVRTPADAATIAWHLYTVQIDFAGLGKPRAQVMAELRQAGVGTQVLYIPVHLQPWYRDRYGYGPGKCPVAESCFAKTLSLPLHAGMTDSDVERVLEAVPAICTRVCV